MSYAVKEIFATLQGEGAHTGRAAVFCRFSGCNLWSGREEDRDRAACSFCDTDFVGTDGPGGQRFENADALAEALTLCWQNAMGDSHQRFVVFTGGEPLLQLDAALITAVGNAGFEMALESNGTRNVPEGLDWICISPKPNSLLVQRHGDELKLVYPQKTLAPQQFESLDFTHFWLQPMDGPEREAHTRAAIAYCLAHPRWRLCVQTHKLIGMP